MDIRDISIEDMQRLSFEEVQAGGYRILQKIDTICRNHHLRYTLSGGTLLGAIRHNGFIPWDDDVDLDMPYPDFLKFLECTEQELQDSDFDLLYGMKRDCGNFIPKMVDTKTLVHSPGRDRKRALSLWVDVLPIFALSDDAEERMDQLRKVRSAMLSVWRTLKTPEVRDFWTLRRWIMTRFFGDRIIRTGLKSIEEAMGRYPFGSTRYVHSVYVYDNEEVRPRIFPTEIFTEHAMHRFAEGEFPIPKDYDTYLRILYGPDYMTPPPPEARGGHGIEVYRLK